VNIVDLLRYAVERGASDLHLSPGSVPFIRVDGELLPTSFPVLKPNDTRDAADSLMAVHKAEEFNRTHEADFAHTLEGVGRFRVNVLRQSGSVGLAIRWVTSESVTFADLHLPEVVQDFAESRWGLVLVTGPTGSGKTTTIASMLGFINRTRRAHIVTIEDPIEVVHDDVMSVIRQREVGLDTDSATGLQVLRQDRVIIGESRLRLRRLGHAAARPGTWCSRCTIDAAERSIGSSICSRPGSNGGSDVVRRSASGSVSQRLPSGSTAEADPAVGCSPHRAGATDPRSGSGSDLAGSSGGATTALTFDQDPSAGSRWTGLTGRRSSGRRQPHDFGLALAVAADAVPGRSAR
jgi:energy-coupling factor transporter ATP-binding protein EcfA2